MLATAGQGLLEGVVAERRRGGGGDGSERGGRDDAQLLRQTTPEQEAALREFVIKEEMQPCWSLILATDVGDWLGSYRDMCTVGMAAIADI
jgi:hypothetical protein